MWDPEIYLGCQHLRVIRALIVDANAYLGRRDPCAETQFMR
jgi:hypothetical protein